MEKTGVTSINIKKYIELLEKSNLSTHSIIMAKGENIFFEKYWEPFDREFLHRQYSVSKSIVSIAVGFCEQDRLICLDDMISKYFPDECKDIKDENLKNQTIRHMLMMATAKPDRYWFNDKPEDRVRYYFGNDRLESRPSGTIFNYDSSASFILGAMVERVTKMSLLDYLRIKLFDKIGVSENIYCLKCPGGHSWGDSGILCTPRDMLKIARFVMNNGMWNGEQILNEEYITKAISKQIDNNLLGLNEADTQGYGYQIWCTRYNGFFFNGMGCQFALCFPDKDLIMIYNGDNQGKALAKKIIIDGFIDVIYKNFTDKSNVLEISNDKLLAQYTDSLKLAVIKGNTTSEFADKFNGVTYFLDENPMGIKEVCLRFKENIGSLEYINEQGCKTIEFGMCENVIGSFPQEGYSNEMGTVDTKGFYYRCASSAAWIEPKKLHIKVQIIDKYFGNLDITIAFTEDNKIAIYMTKAAEDFLKEYEGFASGVSKLRKADC